MTNPMRNITVEKLTFNFGSGKDAAKLEKGIKLIRHITGKDPVKTITNKRIPSWGLRPGLPVGCKLTIRGAAATELVRRLLKAKKDKLQKSQFDNNGSVSFGVKEYIDIPGIEYNPEIGIMGFEVCVTLKRPGFRIKSRRMRPARISKTHSISQDEAAEFMHKQFNTEIGEPL
jgi:large subunit ribosomal protein L5